MKKLTEEIRKILADPEVGRLMNERGLEIMNSTPAEFAASHRTESEVILKRIKDFGLTPQ